MNRTLIIVAHGSSVNPTSASSVVDAANHLQTREVIRARFDVVKARFLKQEPQLKDEDFDDGALVVIPFFMSEGYFVGAVLPGLLPASATVTASLGSADLTALIRDVANEFAPAAHLVLVGHGTERDAESSKTVERAAQALRPSFTSVICSFIDQEPALASTWQRVPDDGAPVVVVPYFAFAGPHTEHDIPNGLGLAVRSAGPHTIAGHEVFYAPPLGTHPRIVDVLADLACGASG